MSKLIINGARPLAGRIKISGSKNSAMPLIAASVLVEETCLENIPRIKDVESMLEIISFLGGKCEWTEGNKVFINTKNLALQPIPETARKLRASILLAGVMLARFGEVQLPYPGGDVIGAR